MELGRSKEDYFQADHAETLVQLSQQKPDDVIEVDLDLDELDITASETKAGRFITITQKKTVLDIRI